MEDLFKLLILEGNELNHFFEKAKIEGKGTPQEVSDRREVALTLFLQKYFPFPYRICKGNIRDSYGNSSNSIDCIILNPCHPYTTSKDGKFSIILADGVDAAIELKPSLNSEEEIHRSLNQIKSVKELKRVKDGLIYFINEPSKAYLENCKRIPSIIFSTETYASIELLIEKIVSYYVTNKITRMYQFDMIVVNQRLILINHKKDNYLYREGTEEGILVIDYNERTLAAFLFFLNQLPQSEPRMGSPVLKHYLSLGIVNTKVFRDLNQRLLNIKE